MGDAFKTKAKQTGIGTCKEHSHIMGGEIFMQNTGDDNVKHWIVCKDLECFKKQGGGEIKERSFSNSTWKAKPVKTLEQMTTEAIAKDELLFNIANKRLKKILGKSIEEFVVENDYQMIVKSLDFISLWSSVINTSFN